MTKLANSYPETTSVITFESTAKTTIVGQGVAFKHQPETPRSSLAFPGVCVLPSGRWLASCRAAPMKIPTRGQHILLSYSDDEGQTWSAPYGPFEPPEVDGKLGLFRGAYLTSLGHGEVIAAIAWTDHSDPTADFFNEETQGLLDSRIFLSRSRDGGRTWTEPQLMDTTPFNVPTPLTGPVLVGRDDEWICQFETNKHYDDLSEWIHSSILMFSRDEGATWPEHSVASIVGDENIFYWDQRPSIASDGSILDLFWTYDSANAKYLNIHARESKDAGRTWSQIWDTGVTGQPAPPVLLPDGRTAMVYVDRTSEPILKLRLSEDDGRSWPEASEIVLYQLGAPSQIRDKNSMQDAWAEMGAYSLGLPTTALLSDGDLLVVFYAGPESDRTDVRWVRIRV